MGRYLALWEVEESKIPIDPRERGEGWALLMSLVRQDIEKGLVKSWGAFIGEAKGYCVWEVVRLKLWLPHSNMYHTSNSKFTQWLQKIK